MKKAGKTVMAIVESSTQRTVIVNANDNVLTAVCSCEDYYYRKRICKHIKFVLKRLALEDLEWVELAAKIIDANSHNVSI